ncbi:hypothetical protein ACJ41O_013958 [Fusarium nematophilum]
MASSNFATTNYTSDSFVESCGAILFDLSRQTIQVCLTHYLARDEWLLPKGRRNCNEHRREAAVREVQEETGYRCRLHPVTMPTRAPLASDAADVADQPRTRPDLDEPFMVSIRQVDGGAGVKLIWWYVAEVDHQGERSAAEEGFEAELFDCREALRKLTFQGDRDILSRAISLVTSSPLQPRLQHAAVKP